MNYSDTPRPIIIALRSRLDLYFTAMESEKVRERVRDSENGRHVFFKLTESRAAAEFIGCSEHRERRPGCPITGMLKLNSNMRRRRDSGNYERLFSTSVLPCCNHGDVLIRLVSSRETIERHLIIKKKGGKIIFSSGNTSKWREREITRVSRPLFVSLILLSFSPAKEKRTPLEPASDFCKRASSFFVQIIS